MTDEGDLYEKVAVAPALAAVGATGLRAGATALARGAGSFLWQGAKSLAGMGTTGTLTGAARAGRAVGTGANAANTALGMHGMVKEIIKPAPPPSPNPVATQATASKTVYSSLNERIEKLAFGPSNALNIASYMSMIGAEVLPHEHPWHARLEALGLGGLAASTAANMISSPDDELKPGAKDLAGLGLFASALNDRMKHAGSLDDYRRALHSDSPETILAGELADAELARKMQGGVGRVAGGVLGATLGAGLGGLALGSQRLSWSPDVWRLQAPAGAIAGGLIGGLAGYRAGGMIPSVRSPYEDMPREEALAKIREEIDARGTKSAAHTDAEYLALAGQAGRDAPREIRHRLGSAEKDMSHLTRAGVTNKVAFLGPGGDAMLLGLPSAVGYLAGRREPMTLDEARHEAAAKMNLAALAAVPGYTGYYHGVRSKAERMLAGEEAPDDTMARAEAARPKSLSPEALRTALFAGGGGGVGAGLGARLGDRIHPLAGVAGAGLGAGLGAWLGHRVAE